MLRMLSCLMVVLAREQLELPEIGNNSTSVCSPPPNYLRHVLCSRQACYGWEWPGDKYHCNFGGMLPTSAPAASQKAKVSCAMPCLQVTLWRFLCVCLQYTFAHGVKKGRCWNLLIEYPLPSTDKAPKDSDSPISFDGSGYILQKNCQKMETIKKEGYRMDCLKFGATFFVGWTQTTS